MPCWKKEQRVCGRRFCKYILQFIGDKPLSAEVPVEMYEEIKRDFAEQLAAVGDKDALVDLHWASDFLKRE